ncbi:T9SS type A sorting domain-containing protein, partial [bacterium]|nr:T9SS type A sorting domain-containing protein [bacterium]
FDPDQAYESSSWGYLGGSIYANSDPITDTYDDPLYQSERWGLDGYKFDVPNGVYEVTLHFAELYYTAAGQRVFHVNIEGNRKLANYDIYKEVGHKTAAKKVFLITVGDRQLNIVFSRAKDYPKISAIEVVRAEAYNMSKSDVADAVPDPVIPESFELHQNFPNPFNPETEIRYDLPFAAAVKLTIFNIRGERVRVLQDQAYEAGLHATVWDARDEWGQGVASGIYFYQIRVTPADNRKKPLIEIRKMTYCK